MYLWYRIILTCGAESSIRSYQYEVSSVHRCVQCTLSTWNYSIRVYILRASTYSINFVAVVNCLENDMVCGHISWLSGKTPYSTQLLDNFRLIELVMKEALYN